MEDLEIELLDSHATKAAVLGDFFFFSYDILIDDSTIALKFNGRISNIWRFKIKKNGSCLDIELLDSYATKAVSDFFFFLVIVDS